jgi:hypothetical protein
VTIKAPELTLQEFLSELAGMIVEFFSGSSIRIRFGKADGFSLYQNEILTKSTKDLTQSD